MKNRKKIYYTEYPTGSFLASTDIEALSLSSAKIIYRESNTKDGTPFKIIRDLKNS